MLMKYIVYNVFCRYFIVNLYVMRNFNYVDVHIVRPCCLEFSVKGDNKEMTTKHSKYIY